MISKSRQIIGQLSNSVKEWIAFLWIGAFTLCWRSLGRLFKRASPAKDHYYIMRFFRGLFRSYDVWIDYPNPLVREKSLYLKVNLCENSHQWFFRLREKYDACEISLLSEGVRNADAFIDVGANIGVYALTISQAFPDRKIIAIEPLGSSFHYLNENILRNGLTNCEAHRKAVCKSLGVVRFYFNPIHDGGGSIVEPQVYKTGDVEIGVEEYRERYPSFRPWIEVESISLDQLLCRKSVVKIDVEGAELDVLQSGRDSLKTGVVDLLVVEVMQQTVDSIIGFMDELEFECYLLPEYRRMSRGIRLPWFVRNIACVRRSSNI